MDLAQGGAKVRRIVKTTAIIQSGRQALFGEIEFSARKMPAPIYR